MANPEHVEILKQGVEVWNKWREQNPDVSPDLSRATLKNKDFSDAHFHRVSFAGSELEGTNFSFSYMAAASFREANLQASNFYCADLFNTDLTNSICRGANFLGTRFKNCNMHGADIERAIIGDTAFLSVDLSHTQGLDKVIPMIASSVDFDTVILSVKKNSAQLSS